MQVMKKLHYTRRRSAFTLVEMMVAMAIASVIMIGISSLMLVSARNAKTIFNMSYVRSAQMRALDQVRYRLNNASIASVATVGTNADIDADGDNDGFQEIRFSDPNLGTGITSRMFFDPAAQTLYYDDDMNDGQDTIAGYADADTAHEGIAISRGPIDVRFLPQSSNALIRLSIRSQAYIASKQTGTDAQGNATYRIVDNQDGVTTVYLRNP